MPFIHLTTETGGRPMLVNVDHIQLVVEEEQVTADPAIMEVSFGDKFQKMQQAITHKRTRIVMRDGEGGYCQESFHDVESMIKGRRKITNFDPPLGSPLVGSHYKPPTPPVGGNGPGDPRTDNLGFPLR